MSGNRASVPAAASTTNLPPAGLVPDEVDLEMESMVQSWSSWQPFDFVRELFCPTAFPSVVHVDSRPQVPSSKLKLQDRCVKCDPRGCADCLRAGSHTCLSIGSSAIHHESRLLVCSALTASVRIGTCCDWCHKSVTPYRRYRCPIWTRFTMSVVFLPRRCPNLRAR
jgi:hypothetical protein